MAHAAHTGPPAENREIELKLEVAAVDLPKLRHAVSAVAGEDSKNESRDLITTYFDTADLELKSKGVALRVRTQDGRQRQSIKAASTESAGGLMDRGEWEQDIDGDEPDLAAARNTPLEPLVARKRIRRALQPIFRTVVHRSTHAVSRDGATLEIAIDEASAEAGHATASFYELELELISGERTVLYELARNLIERVPLRIGVLSKAERGYALLAEGSPQAFKADPVALGRDLSAAGGFRTIGHSCIRHFRLNEPILTAHRSAEALHQARVALRRLRAAFSLFKTITADVQIETIKHELKWISTLLGNARNHDVFLKRIDGRVADQPLGSAALIEQVRNARERAYDGLMDSLGSARFQASMLQLVEWLDVGPWTQRSDDRASKQREISMETFASGVLEDRRRKVKKRGRHLKTLDAEHRHRLRIQAKKLRYASDFFAPPLFGGRKATRRHAAFMDTLEDMQDCLGALNDIATARDLVTGLVRSPATLAETESAFAAGRVTGSEEAREPVLLALAAKSYRRFVRADPFWR